MSKNRGFLVKYIIAYPYNENAVQLLKVFMICSEAEKAGLKAVHVV